MQVSELTPDQLEAFASAAFKAITSGQWTMVAALALVLVVWVLRKYGAKRLPWLATQAGGATLLLAASFAGALLTAITGGGALSWAVAAAAFKVAFSAAGGWTLVKHLAAPLLAKAGLSFEAAAVQAEAKAEGAKASEAAKPVDPMDVVNK